MNHELSSGTVAATRRSGLQETLCIFHFVPNLDDLVSLEQLLFLNTIV